MGKGLFAGASGGDGRDGFLIEPSAGNHQHEDGNPQKARFNMQIIKQDDVNEIDLQCQQAGLFECQTDPVSGCAGIQQRKQPAQKKDKSRRNKNKGIPVQTFGPQQKRHFFPETVQSDVAYYAGQIGGEFDFPSDFTLFRQAASGDHAQHEYSKS